MLRSTQTSPGKTDLQVKLDFYLQTGFGVCHVLNALIAVSCCVVNLANMNAAAQ